MILCLAASAVCLVGAAVINWRKSKALSNHIASLEAGNA